MRPNVSTQIQRTQGVRKGKTAKPAPVATNGLSTDDQRVVAEVLIDLAVTGADCTCTSTANGDGTFTWVYSFPFESTV